MLSKIEKALPAGSEWSRPEGGMFVWARLPEGHDTGMMLRSAVANQGIAYVPGQAFYSDERGKNTLRLSFTLPSLEEIEVGMRRLGAVFR